MAVFFPSPPVARPTITKQASGEDNLSDYSERNDKVQITLDMTPELNARIEEMAKLTGGTKSEILRKAIVLLDVAMQAKLDDVKILLQSDDQTTEIVGLF